MRSHDHCTQQASGMTFDSDVVERPSRRWRGAVQQLADFIWESQFSCDYPCSRNRESNFFLTDLLTFFLFSSSGNCLKNIATDFFYSFRTISGDETKSGYVEKYQFLYFSKYFGRLTFELWHSVATFCRKTQDQAVETKKPDIFDTVIELDITGKWVFGRGLWPIRVY